MNLTAEYRRTPDLDDSSGTAYQLHATLPDGTERTGPVIYSATPPTESDALRTARRLWTLGYWRVSEMEVAA